MHKTLRITMPAILLAGVAGCQGVGGLNWSSPGTVEEQRMQAQRFDPYPIDEAGPPVEGARPRGFQTPPAEVERSRWSPVEWGR